MARVVPSASSRHPSGEVLSLEHVRRKPGSHAGWICELSHAAAREYQPTFRGQKARTGLESINGGLDTRIQDSNFKIDGTRFRQPSKAALRRIAGFRVLSRPFTRFLSGISV